MDKRERSKAEEIRPAVDERTASVMRARERMREINIDDKMNPADILYFPPEKVPHGWTYKWIRISTMGEPDQNHERLQMRRGWSPVPADRHPEEARNHLHASDIHAVGNIIVRRGLMLCELPKEAADKYDSVKDKAHQDVMKSLSTAVQQMPQDPTVPRGILENSDDVTPNLGRTFGFS
jgi:hypothetical protein